MGTNMEHRGGSDNDVLLSWEITGPDDDGYLWLEAGHTIVNLGPQREAMIKLADYLAEHRMGK